MVQNVLKSRYVDISCKDSEKSLASIKKYINNFDCPEMTLDLSRLNILDAAKVMMLSSAYHYKKYPAGKLKCKVQSQEIKGLVSAYMTKNLEVVD